MAKNKRESEAAYLARKSERLAQTRQEQDRQRSRRRITIAAALGVVILLALTVMLTRRGSAPTEAQKLAAAQAANPVASFGVGTEQAGCEPVVLTPPQPEWTRHVDGDFAYDASPPAGGPHSDKTLPTGDDHFYDREDQPAPERGVHDLEHGLVVAWYDAAMPEAEVAALRQVARSAGDKKLRFLATPWARTAFPGDKRMVLTAWGVTQRCARVSGSAVEAFVAKYADAEGLPERGFKV